MMPKGKYELAVAGVIVAALPDILNGRLLGVITVDGDWIEWWFLFTVCQCSDITISVPMLPIGVGPIFIAYMWFGARLYREFPAGRRSDLATPVVVYIETRLGGYAG
ncbi:hypothetical protein GWI33_016332 [Rhynchophorus ferrugineus]|uniref:Uncharacterized protein n=1 Tax=Rhynchophorus ferrugineus TaxID=354439 RepID=A0A834M8T6_RHYFE|nr:hypothetical protein GWI33_016332 [Rhynchophorus ferrugineus]